MKSQTPIPAEPGIADFHKVPFRSLQRKCSCGQHSGGGECAACSRKQRAVQRQVAGQLRPAMPPVVDQELDTPGRSLDTSSRRFMEHRFGHDFSHVRVHTGPQAHASARAIGALAYTRGADIVFADGAYAPDSLPGRHLLAHELTHVVQQGRSGGVQTKSALGAQNDPAEREADHVADVVTHGTGAVPFPVQAGTAPVQRACGPAGIGAPVGCAPQAPAFIAGNHLTRFAAECDEFAPAELAGLQAFARTIAPTGAVTVHGYASIDGDATFNENLSCARAIATRSVLTGEGVAAGRIATQRHGPTPGPTADRRSATVEAPIAPPAPIPVPPTPAPPAPPVNVLFTPVLAASSPAGMPARIPPRVDTLAAAIVTGFTPPMLPITISVDGAGGTNGAATINGAATVDVTGTSLLRLRGTTQTTPGSAGNLHLSATQGGAPLATSNDFSVSSIPQNWTTTFLSALTGARRGFIVQDGWESDSGVVADLDETAISEIIDVAASGGSLAGPGGVSGFLPGNVFTTDTHSSPAGLATPGFRITKQVSIFNDRRSGAVNIPVRNSGYRITRVVVPVFPIGAVFRISKFGAAVTAGGVSSGAGVGSITRLQIM